jgi:hypothetical protein
LWLWLWNAVHDLGDRGCDLAHLVQDETDLRSLGGDGHQYRTFAGGHQDHVPVGPFDEDLRQVALLEARRGALAQAHQSRTHGGQAVFLDVRGQRRSHGQTVGTDHRRCLDIGRNREEIIQRGCQLVGLGHVTPPSSVGTWKSEPHPHLNLRQPADVS